MLLPRPKFNKRQAFGQHFLIDQIVIDQIVNSFAAMQKRNPESSVLEIGPGEGALTIPLSKLGIPNFYLAERDRVLVDRWKSYPGIKKLIEGDFVTIPEEWLTELGNFLVISNLPYSAGTAILGRLVERAQFARWNAASGVIPEMLLMFQKEVADRLLAEPSTPDRGSLSLLIQNQFEVRLEMAVPPKAFDPPPKVDSSVLHFIKRVQPLFAVDNATEYQQLQAMWKLAFQHRRKMLRVNFKGTHWLNGLTKAGIEDTRRAESLSNQDWVNLWKTR